MIDRRTLLIGLLKAHRGADSTEKNFIERMQELCRSAGDPFSRAHYRPGHFTASAFVLSPDRSSLLLIHHGKLDRWLQPGGHVDPEDVDVLAAARREVAEETGVTALVPLVEGLFDVDVHRIPARKEEPEHRHFDLRLLFGAEDTDFAAGSDARDARWVPLGEVDRLESDDSVMRAVAKLR